jgi:hypothetical protein
VGRPLSTGDRAALDPFFPSATLDDVRVAVVPAIPGPPLAGFLRGLGLATADFARVVGITFADTIVVAERLKGAPLLATLFHELVHVEQMRRLGLAGFMRRYVEGWLATGRYAAVSLERDAYDLQRRFERAPREPFDVAAEVAVRLSPSSAGTTPARRTPRNSPS